MPEFSIERSVSGLLRVRLALLQTDQVRPPIDLIPAQAENLAAAHSEVITDHQQRLLMAWEFVTELDVIGVRQKSFTDVVRLVEHRERWNLGYQPRLVFIPERERPV